MSEVYLLPAEERQLFFDAAVAKSGIPFPVLEKDFWVVWTLERLFSLQDLKTYLTFKGGTSLSKAYGIIERFSEDIDLSIEKSFFGIDPEKAESKKKRQIAIDTLVSSCSAYIQNKMLKDLRKSIATKLKTAGGWELSIDPKDPARQTILFEYPNITPKGYYIQQSVKIEIGARTEHWPVSMHEIQSYLKRILKEKVHEPAVQVRVLNAERTFWEKATILHQYAHLPETKKLPPRISRHHYDFFCLLNSDIKEKASTNHNLLTRVAAHKSIYFASGWANYGAAKKGTLKLLPPKRICKMLEDDFELMREMFFGNIPEWRHILETIEKFEAEFNAQ